MKKNILVVTVYNSENCGSFLQAYALKRVIEGFGCQVYHLKRTTKDTSHSFFPHIKYAFMNVMRLNFSYALSWLKKWFIYEKYIRTFNVIEEDEQDFSVMDVAVLGSDTIWNFKDQYFQDQASVFLGSKLDVPKVITYATSVANTPFQLFKDTVSRNGGIDHISNLLLRDNETQEYVSKITNKAAEIVCDPTLLLKKEDYLDFNKEIPCKKFLLLYYFNKIDNDLKSEIIAFANKNGLKVISLVQPFKWCDYFAENSPSDMLSYYANASYIITDTFHGTIFSLLYEKQFAVHNANKNKVNELLEWAGESSRLFSNSNDLEKILSLKFSENTTKRINVLRDNSIDLLYTALK